MKMSARHSPAPKSPDGFEIRLDIEKYPQPPAKTVKRSAALPINDRDHSE
jgi:hypothetical protein